MLSTSVRVSVCTATLLLLLVLLVVFVVFSGGSRACDDVLAECDAYKPTCANYQGEHQFFYSQCDMLRENCMTGADWIHDHISHCNVYI